VEKPAIKLFPYPDTEYAKFNYKLKIENSNRASIPEMTVRKYDTYDAYTINGTVTHWTKAIKCLNVAVSRPGLYFATVLKETLEKNGITFNGRLVKDSFDPEGYPVFYEIESAPLIEIMKTMNRQSNNLIAENLGKYMGMKEFGVPGNREKALKVINAVLLESGFDQSSFDIRDTCGLSQQTRITSALMIHTLKTIYDNPDWKTLAIDSFDPKTYSGLQCFVKTGTLSSTGVNSLAGFIKDSKTGKFYAFCIIVNKASGAKAWSGTYTNPLITKLTNILKNR
ncbi:D-alanyl-D-alanine carboxypeptidase/D-alanyl-D-alanine-endopeptidase, partial [Candidatus Peregrinibacteria bacterium RIFOXYA12_FULL_33_12]